MTLLATHPLYLLANLKDETTCLKDRVVNYYEDVAESDLDGTVSFRQGLTYAQNRGCLSYSTQQHIDFCIKNYGSDYLPVKKEGCSLKWTHDLPASILVASGYLDFEPKSDEANTSNDSDIYPTSNDQFLVHCKDESCTCPQNSLEIFKQPYGNRGRGAIKLKMCQPIESINDSYLNRCIKDFSTKLETPRGIDSLTSPFSKSGDNSSDTDFSPVCQSTALLQQHYVNSICNIKIHPPKTMLYEYRFPRNCHYSREAFSGKICSKWNEDKTHCELFKCIDGKEKKTCKKLENNFTLNTSKCEKWPDKPKHPKPEEPTQSSFKTEEGSLDKEKYELARAEYKKKKEEFEKNKETLEEKWKKEKDEYEKKTLSCRACDKLSQTECKKYKCVIGPAQKNCTNNYKIKPGHESITPYLDQGKKILEHDNSYINCDRSICNSTSALYLVQYYRDYGKDSKVVDPHFKKAVENQDKRNLMSKIHDYLNNKIAPNTLVEKLAIGKGYVQKGFNSKNGFGSQNVPTAGDIVQIIRSDNGGQINGHSVVFHGFLKNSAGKIEKICYFSSQPSTNGYGPNCENIQSHWELRIGHLDPTN